MENFTAEIYERNGRWFWDMQCLNIGIEMTHVSQGRDIHLNSYSDEAGCRKAAKAAFKRLQEAIKNGKFATRKEITIND